MYKDKEPKELLELVNKHEMLTFGSQIQLRDEVNARGLPMPIDGLDAAINDKISKIKNFEYLPDLGFRVDQVENPFRVVRTTKALLTDILAILLGFIFIAFCINGIIKLFASVASGAEVGFSSIITAVVYFALGFMGIKFLSGIKRLLDFMGFELSKTDRGISLKKRFDLKLEELKSEVSGLSLERYKDKMILKLDHHDLMDSNANDITQKMTIESLFQKLKN